MTKNPRHPLMGDMYKHYKGGTYIVLSMANHSETNEAMVIYQSINFGTIYARPYESWKSKTETGRVRFKKISKNGPTSKA